MENIRVVKVVEIPCILRFSTKFENLKLIKKTNNKETLENIYYFFLRYNIIILVGKLFTGMKKKIARLSKSNTFLVSLGI